MLLNEHALSHHSTSLWVVGFGTLAMAALAQKTRISQTRTCDRTVQVTGEENIGMWATWKSLHTARWSKVYLKRFFTLKSSKPNDSYNLLRNQRAASPSFLQLVKCLFEQAVHSSRTSKSTKRDEHSVREVRNIWAEILRRPALPLFPLLFTYRYETRRYAQGVFYYSVDEERERRKRVVYFTY